MKPDEYMRENTPKFKEKSRKFYTRLRNLASTIPIILILYILTFYLSPINHYVTPIALLILVIYILSVIVVFNKISKERPSFKEYVLYYFWQGKYYLDRYLKDNSSEEDIKNSLKFFNKLQNVLFQNYNSFGPHRFETEENMEKSIKWLEIWIRKVVIDSLKKRETKINSLVNEVFKGTYENLIDENFSGMVAFLKPYVALYVVKSDNNFINFINWLHSS